MPRLLLFGYVLRRALNSLLLLLCGVSTLLMPAVSGAVVTGDDGHLHLGLAAASHATTHHARAAVPQDAGADHVHGLHVHGLEKIFRGSVDHCTAHPVHDHDVVHTASNRSTHRSDDVPVAPAEVAVQVFGVESAFLNDSVVAKSWLSSRLQRRTKT